MTALHAVPGSSVTLPDNGFDVPEGCVFGGWVCQELDPDSHQQVIKTYPAYSRIENVNENRTMYAKWLSMITIGTEDQEVTYSPDGIAIPVEGMFAIPEDAGKATYSVDNLMGTGTYDTKTGILAVSESGTFTVRVNTAETDTHAAASADAVLTVIRNLPPFGEADFVLPTDTAVIEESAFEGVSGLRIVDAAGCTSIRPNAFSGTGLAQIRLPGDCAIDPLAFDGCGTVCVFAPADGQTETSCAGIENCVFMEIRYKPDGMGRME